MAGPFATTFMLLCVHTILHTTHRAWWNHLIFS